MIVEVLDRHISITPDLAGGKPHITGHRITVQNIVIWHEHMGKSADEICAEYNLELAEVYAALAYYFDHREEIDRSIRESNLYVTSLRQSKLSILQQKIKKIRSE
ncbi:MAG: DUF433 domain-containing protein [Candidatus Competibacteraceae bacterium]